MKTHPQRPAAHRLAALLAATLLVLLVGASQAPARAYNTPTHRQLVEEAFRILHLPEMEATYPGVYDYYADLDTLCGHAGDPPLLCDIPREGGAIDPEDNSAGSYGGGRYRVTRCENASYAGACSSYLADDPWLGDDASGNGRASSAKIEVSTNCTGDGVYLYEDIDYWGRCWKWTTDDPLFDEENFHDVASSLRFMGSYGDGRYTATLYQDLNYGGASTAFGADDPWLGDDAIGNDQADAIRIRTVPACTGDGVYLYEGENYTGRCRNFTASEPYLDTVAFADIASSVRLVGSYAGGDTKVTLCSAARYGGTCSIFAGNDANLGDDGVGSDRASSLLLEPLCSAVTEIPQAECRALVALYNSTNGAHWFDQSGWLATNTPCTAPWYGIECASDRVNILGLRHNGLSGAIPAQLGDLTHLGGLDLAANGLSGAIPPQLGGLTALWYLHLGDNQLSDAIPSQLGNLTSLKKLYLRENQLSGAIPPQLGNLTSLEELLLNTNQLSGAIPSQLGDLTALWYLDLSKNQLSGAIPPQLGDLTSLQMLFLDQNQLSGVIPPQLGDLASLWQLTLDSNQLSGTVPPQLGDLTELRVLGLDHTLLSGALPATLTRLSLTSFRFNDTQLCEPPDPIFQAWLAGICGWQRTGVKCPVSTSTPTPTATRTRTPTPTATRTGGVTPSPTPTPTATRAPLPCGNLLRNGDFEAGVLAPWATDQQAGLGAGRGAGHGGWLGGVVNADAELFQEVMIPAPANLGKLAFWWQADAASAQPGDRLAVLIQYGEQADPVWSQAVDDPPGQWRRQEVDLSAYRGMSVLVTFHAHNDAGVATTFRVDDVDLPVCGYRMYLPIVLQNPPAATLIFSDNFNDGDLAGWAPHGGAWQNTGSALRGQRADGVGYDMRPEAGADFTYEATVTIHSGAAGLTFRASADGADSDCLALDPAAGRVKFCINGPWWYGAAQEMTLQYDRAYRLRVVARGTSFDVYLDGVKLFTTTSAQHAAGRFGVLVYEGAATFDDVTTSAP